MLEYLYTGAYNDDAATAPKVAGMKRTASESSLDELPGSRKPSLYCLPYVNLYRLRA